MTGLLLKTFVKDFKNVKSTSVRKGYGTLAGVTGVTLNIILFIIKLTAGVLTSAISVTADAFNNLTDAGSSIITLVGFKLAGKKGDKEHPFGHGRIEYISGLLIAIVILFVGVELFKSSIKKILKPDSFTFDAITLVILIFSILVKIWMTLFYKKLSNLIRSQALKAYSFDSLSDSASTLVILIGLVFGHYTGINIDGYLGVLVALLIIWGGINAAKDIIKPLLGTTPSPELVKAIKDTVLSYDEIIGIHDLIVHDYGPTRTMVSLHAEVPDDSDFLAIHDTIDLIEIELNQKFNCNAIIHMDPVAYNDEFSLSVKEKIVNVVNQLDETLSIHDFRISTGPTHTNIIFDVLTPFNYKMSDQQLVETLETKIKEINETYFAVIQVDKDYIGYNL